MKTRKLILALVRLVVLLLGTALVASAGDQIRLTDGMNQSYFGFGWEWVNVNISLDSRSPAAEGQVK